MKILDTIKEHPYVAAGGVFVLGIILILMFAGGGKQAAQTVSTPQTDTQGATQLAMAQLEAQAATHASDNAVVASANTNAASVQAQQIAASTQVNHDNLVSQTAIQLAGLDNQQKLGVATIAANVAQSQIVADYQAHLSDNNSAVQIAGISANQATTIAGITANHDIQIAGIQADAAKTISNMQLQTQGELAGIASNQATYTSWLQSATLQALASQNTPAAMLAIQTYPGTIH